jgi:AcrR family transcriptional regulator
MDDVTADGRRVAVGDATRLRLIESAERLVAERGVDSVSVREITAAAGANSASIHYHVRSKEGLLRAVLAHRAEFMRERRLRYLQELDSEDPSLDAIARAMVRPTFELATSENADEAASYVAFIAALLEQGSMVPIVQEYFDDQFQAYAELLQVARPDLSKDAVINRLSFALFLVFNAASEPARGLRTWIAQHDSDALAQLEYDLVGFVTGGLSAPA